MNSPLALLRTFLWKMVWESRGRHEDVVAARGGTGTTSGELEDTIEYVAVQLKLGPEDTLLDIGCSIGYVVDRFAGIVRSITAIDISSTAVARARDVLRDRTNVEVLQAEAAHVPKGPQSFSKILCLSVVHYFPSKRYWNEFLQEIQRLLEPGGLALIVDVPRKGKLDLDTMTRYSLLQKAVMLPITITVGLVIQKRYTHAEVMRTAARANLTARILPQPKSLPFWKSRFDVLLSHEVQVGKRTHG